MVQWKDRNDGKGKRIMWIVLIAVGTVTVLSLTGSYAAYVLAFRRTGEDVTHKVLQGPEYEPYAEASLELIKEGETVPFEEVRIRSYDGLELFGRLYLKDPARPFHIQFNGYRGNGQRDFAGGLKLALEAGDNVLLTDQRSHGKSGGKTICMGVRERFDVRSWTAYVAERFGKDTNVFLEGISMGAATVLTASDLTFGCPVLGIVADCPYSSPSGILRAVCRKRYRAGDLLLPFLWAGAFLFGHFSLSGASALKSVPHASAPILLIHGTADTFVPFSMSEEIYSLRPDLIRFVPVEGAPHGLSYFRDNERYVSAVRSFREDCLKKAGK